MTAYRNRDAALRSRIGSARERIRTLESGIVPEAYEYLPDLAAFDAARVAGQRAVEATEVLDPAAPTASLEAWARALEDFAASLEAVAMRLPSLEALALAVPAHPPRLVRSRRDRILHAETTSVQIDREIDRYSGQLGKCLEAFGGRIDHGGWEPRRLPPRVYFASARVGPTHLSNLVEVEVPRGAPLFFTGFAVGVPRALPPVSVLPTTSLWQRLFGGRGRLGKERPTGDDAFDGSFSVRSPSPSSSLTAEVRKKLLDLSRYDVPELTIEDGVATLRYTYDPEVPVLRAAIEIMLAVCRLDFRVRFTR